MLRKFSMTLLSSWIVNPLGILVAQAFGVANSTIIILVLLGIGTCVPFQLLMNECLAVGATGRNTIPTKSQIALILSMQTLSCGSAIWLLSDQDFYNFHILLTLLALAANTLNSYRISLVYYKLVAHNKITLSESMMVGAVPGITSLTLYVLFCLLSQIFKATSDLAMISTTVLPGAVQWIYLKSINANNGGEPSNLAEKNLAKLSYKRLLITILILAGLAVVSTKLRETISHFSLDHTALLLVLLNSLLSVINTATRAAFLKEKNDRVQISLIGLIIISLALMTIGHHNEWKYTLIFGLLASQTAIAFAIEVLRKPTSSLRKFA